MGKRKHSGMIGTGSDAEEVPQNLRVDGSLMPRVRLRLVSLWRS